MVGLCTRPLDPDSLAGEARLPGKASVCTLTQGGYRYCTESIGGSHVTAIRRGYDRVDVRT